MLDNKIIKKIEDFVYKKPRAVQEIAQYIGKNWRTADRYIQEIEKEYSTISTRTFREGTRGALKIAYWASMEKVSSSVFQEKLAQEIETFRKKEDFSAFDIYQHVPKKDKKASVERAESEDKTDLNELRYYLNNARKKLLVFTGNLSWINLKDEKNNIYDVLDKLVKKNVSIKVISRVDISSLKNIEKLLSLNFKHGKELIEIRHREQPLRCLIFDNKIARIKEIKEPTGRLYELNKR